MNTPTRVESGVVVVLRLYDVAYAIDLASVELLGAAGAPAGAARIQLAQAEPKAIAFGEAPVGLGLGQLELELAGRRVAAEVRARVYDFGVVSVAVRIPVAGATWDEYVLLATAADAVLGAAGSGELWARELARVTELIAPALERPSSPGLEEDYLLSIVHRFDRPLSAESLLRDVDLAPLLSGERAPLSEAARRDLLRHTYSYFRDDLVVITWDHAFLVDPLADPDVADVLEVANAQLLELRYYDELLDGELPRMYYRVAEAHRTLRALSRGRYARLAQQLYVLVAEITEIREKIDNALKVTEDVYLARIYATALELFRVGAWASSVDRKLAIVRDTYATLYDEAATARAELLEAAIVLLIVLEIVLAFVL